MVSATASQPPTAAKLRASPPKARPSFIVVGPQDEDTVQSAAPPSKTAPRTTPASTRIALRPLGRLRQIVVRASAERKHRILNHWYSGNGIASVIQPPKFSRPPIAHTGSVTEAVK